MQMIALLKRAIADFFNDHCPRSSAALAYYAIFSLPPLLIIGVSIASHAAHYISFAEDGGARREILREARQTFGEDAAEQIDAMIERALSAPRSMLGVIGSAIIFLIGASGVMVQLQATMNEVWKVRPDPEKSGLMQFLIKRLLSFAMVLSVSLVLIASMLVGTLVSKFGAQLQALLPGAVIGNWPMVVGGVTDLIVETLLFAAMFRWLPDARVAWRDVWIGAITTSLLFIVGKAVLTFYFARADVASTYGAAGSLVLILLWFYYAGMIFLFGAELTRAVAVSRNGDEHTH